MKAKYSKEQLNELKNQVALKMQEFSRIRISPAMVKPVTLEEDMHVFAASAYQSTFLLYFKVDLSECQLEEVNWAGTSLL